MGSGNGNAGSATPGSVRRKWTAIQHVIQQNSLVTQDQPGLRTDTPPAKADPSQNQVKNSLNKNSKSTLPNGQILSTTNNLNILNTGQSTRISYQSGSAIDLTICSPILYPEMVWSVLNSPGGSDHCPIILSIFAHHRNSNPIENWRFKDAQWSIYKNCNVWNFCMRKKL